jgi:predicted RNase H-like nuclease (RuvC/YqgF family)
MPRTEQDPIQESEPVFELAEEPSQSPDRTTDSIEPSERSREPQSSVPLSEPHQPASVASIEKAIEEVSAVVESLRTSLEEMEEVLELLEVFERQKTADEREIESLRRAVRQMHRPRDAGHHSHR